MSHDIEASWATLEIASSFMSKPQLYFSKAPKQSSVSSYAYSDTRRTWPVADGAIHIEIVGAKPAEYEVALEYKRKGEGLHGILTAIGQAYAYLQKGFSASLIVMPEEYDTMQDPGSYVKTIVDNTSIQNPIGIFTYVEPDSSQLSPFKSKLQCLRQIELDKSRKTAKTSAALPRVATQWGHVREGSTDPHAFYCYLKTSIELALGVERKIKISTPQPMIAQFGTMKAKTNIVEYLSNCSGQTFHDKVWRDFWLRYVFHTKIRPIWKKTKSGKYMVNNKPSKIRQWGGVYKMFFSGRSDSIKDNLVSKLNKGYCTEKDAWIKYMKNVRARAHSYREDIDSGLSAFGFLGPDGRPTELGYKFVDACERTGSCEAGIPKAIFGSALLNNANFAALLHYIYRLSEEKFSKNAFSFTVPGTKGSMTFDRMSYLSWLEKNLSEKLRVMRTVSKRGGAARKPLQAEFAILRHMDFIKSYRVGVGIEINWPDIQTSMQYPI